MTLRRSLLNLLGLWALALALASASIWVGYQGISLMPLRPKALIACSAANASTDRCPVLPTPRR
jgi:hypothetical protein